MFRFSAPPPLSLYIHFPWCERKCPYCDFNSHSLKNELPEQAYIHALLKDLEQELPSVWGRSVHSIFLGGGTPSLFSVAAIEQLLDGVRARLPLHPGAEITLEANPGSAEQERFSGYRKAGVNRLSIGIQSLDDRHLQALGRIHNSEQALGAAKSARQAGFDNFNLDLMYGLPGQETGEAIRDLGQLIDLQPPHISWYQLTLEPNTFFHAHPPKVPDDECKWEILQRGQELLQKHDYIQYEVSAYSREGHRCAHNLNYWKFGDYLGIGAGAHGKITDGANNCIYRYSRKKHPQDYLAAAGTEDSIDTRRQLTEAETVFEFTMNHLRLNQGFNLEEFENRCGLECPQILPLLEKAQRRGLLTLDDGIVKHSEHGWLFLDDLIELFLPEHPHA